MNGVHDLGGTDGFGAVDVEANEPVFHADWERRVFALTALVNASRLRNVHRFRHAIERMEPRHYLGSPYYEHWLTALATLLVEAGALAAAELETRAGGIFPLSQPLRGEAPQGAVASGATPRFSVGSRVLVRNDHPVGHTRCPRYVRGKRGVVVRVNGPFPLPDAAAHAQARCVQYQYSVRFAAAELWGVAAEAGGTVHVDLCEGYLESA